MKITVTSDHMLDVEANIYVVRFYKNQDLSECRLDKILNNQLSEFIFPKKEFIGDFGQIYLLPTVGKTKAEKILLVGLGEKKDFNFDKLRQVIAKAIQKCDTMNNNKKVAISYFIVHTFSIISFITSIFRLTSLLLIFSSISISSVTLLILDISSKELL